MRPRALGLWLTALSCWLDAGCVADRPEGETSGPTDAVEEALPDTVPAARTPETVSQASPPAPEQPEPIPEPSPAPFAGHETVRVDELLAALSREVEGVAASPAVREDYQAFLSTFELSDQDELYLDYVRVKIAFEATRAGGLWGLKWDITNEQPRSDLIWAHWQTLELGSAPATVDELAPLPPTTAVAECDELSALFAFVAQRIGLSRSSEVGLFWPTGNHTVAVWTIDAKGEAPTRVVIPTSQIFLDESQSLGTHDFNPWKQKSIFDYRRQDAAASLELPGALASQFVLAVREHGPRSQAQLQQLRNDREARQ